MKIFREPLVQFLLLGAVFYVLFAWIGGPDSREPEKVIRVTAADISRLEAGWRAQRGRKPTSEEFQGLVKGHIREVALYRHAVAMGLDRNNATLRRMLGQKLRLLSQNLVELSLSPTEEDLKKFFDANEERYRPPDLITFTQVFFNPDRRDDATLRDAEAALAELRSLKDPTKDLERFGDSIMLQRYYPSKPEYDVQREFGRGFAKSVFKLSPGTWQGPVLSGYGVHLVYVHELEKAPMPELAALREEVKQDWVMEKRRELQDGYVNEVVAGYEVVLEDLPPEEGEPPSQAAEDD